MGEDRGQIPSESGIPLLPRTQYSVLLLSRLRAINNNSNNSNNNNNNNNDNAKVLTYSTYVLSSAVTLESLLLVSWIHL